MIRHSPIAPANRPGTGWSRRAHRQRGAVSVELGILLPGLALIFLALIGFGLLYNAQITLQGAVREGARALAVGGNGEEATRDAAPGFGSDIVFEDISECTEAGDEARVRVAYDYVFVVPFLDLSRTLRATGVMRCERGGG